MPFNALCLRQKRKLAKTCQPVRLALLVMNLTTILLLAACLQVHASGYSQKVTLALSDVPLQKVFKEIKKQTRYNFLYTTELLNKAGSVSIEVKNASIQNALEFCLKGTTLTYSIINTTIIIKDNKGISDVRIPTVNEAQKIKGKVTDENGNGLQGASVVIKGTTKGVNTDANGDFEIEVEESSSKILVISFVGRETKEINISGKDFVAVRLNAAIADQQEIVVVG